MAKFTGRYNVRERCVDFVDRAHVTQSQFHYPYLVSALVTHFCLARASNIVNKTGTDEVLCLNNPTP